ncbi:MAG: Y-family DNA polymerase [Bacteroidales bacterium]|nr:Y-family DNA polymerase [Bacteroidales bacterium]
MNKIFALVDCNNFYASCERIFHPSLGGKPVVVLSNNDGCVIARSEEAKRAGIKMAVPVFEISDLIKQHGVHVFSTNYALYGDISQRVMNILAESSPDMEIYSIDEAFLDLSAISLNQLQNHAIALQSKILKWTGIPVSIGIGYTKIQAKLANHIAKTDPDRHGVFSLVGHPDPDSVLEEIPLNEIWGVGEKYSAFFEGAGIASARELKYCDENRIREKLGVVGQRLVLELRGTVCYPLNQNPANKKEICTSRSFGRPLTKYEELEAATADYVDKVARKLRKQKSLAQSVLIFIMTNKYDTGPKYVNYKIVKLPVPTNQSHELIHFALIALKSLYREGFRYKKSGAIVSEVIPDAGQQTSLWDEKGRAKHKKLLKVIDKINENAGLDVVKFAVQDTDSSWGMRQHHLSPHYTTRWNDILEINLDDH